MENLITGRSQTVGSETANQRALIAATTQLDATDSVVYVDCSETFTVTLPNVAESAGRKLLIVGVGTGGAVTVATPADGIYPAASIANLFTQDDLTAAGDFKLLENIAGVQWIELKELTT